MANDKDLETRMDKGYQNIRESEYQEMELKMTNYQRKSSLERFSVAQIIVNRC